MAKEQSKNLSNGPGPESPVQEPTVNTSGENLPSTEEPKTVVAKVVAPVERKVRMRALRPIDSTIGDDRYVFNKDQDFEVPEHVACILATGNAATRRG